MRFQQTIKKRVALNGVGLHSGRPARIVLAPAPANSGVVFRVPGHASPIRASTATVVDSHYATTLGIDGIRIRTVEHLLAAVGGLAIDNLTVEVEGGEIPAADGSAAPFVSLLRSAGRAMVPARQHPIVLARPVRVGDGVRCIEILPSETFRITYTLANRHPAIGTQVMTCVPTERLFAEELAPARTYAFLRDFPSLRARGLASGGSLDNAVVLGKRGVLNELRFSDEFVRHKVLDLIGDLTLLGRPIVGHVIARNGGHALNFELVMAIERALGLTRWAADEPADGMAAATSLTAAPGFAAL